MSPKTAKAEILEALDLYLENNKQLRNSYERLESLYRTIKRTMEESDELFEAYEESEKKLMSLLPKASTDSLRAMVPKMVRIMVRDKRLMNRRKAND